MQSPDGDVVVSFRLQEGGTAVYSIQYFGKPLVLESRLGFEPDFTNGFQVTGTSTDEHARQWTQVYGERKVVPDNYRELNVDLKHTSGKVLRLTFRAYNEEQRYGTLASESAHDFNLTAEKTEFHFPPNTWGYEEHATEGEYKRSLKTSSRSANVR